MPFHPFDKTQLNPHSISSFLKHINACNTEALLAVSKELKGGGSVIVEHTGCVSYRLRYIDMAEGWGKTLTVTPLEWLHET